MSQFNTVTHHEAPQLRGVSLRWIGGLVLALALGLGLGYLISNINTGEESAVAAISETMAFEEFVRLNTADLDYLAPAAVSVPAVDAFTHLNVNSYDGLIDGVLATKAVAPGFTEINVTSYEGLNEAVAAKKVLAPGFWEANVTAYEYAYTEPASGPR
jgi:hypothetical protein